MFDFPDAKRVRREDLESLKPSPEPSTPDLELVQLLQSQLSQVYGETLTKSLTEYHTVIVNTHDEQNSASQDRPISFEFRLFAAPPAGEATAASTDHEQNSTNTEPAPAPHIILDLDESGGLWDLREQNGAFTVPRRDDGYYFTGAMAPEWTLKQKREFEEAAISAADVKRWLEVRFTGWEVKWRVRHLRVRGKDLIAAEGKEEGFERAVATVAAPLVASLKAGRRGERVVGDHPSRGRKGKVGKKRRIILRMRKRKLEEESERNLRINQKREEAEREKRTRRNREKKVKRKMKEKEKKVLVQNEVVDSIEVK